MRVVIPPKPIGITKPPITTRVGTPVFGGIFRVVSGLFGPRPKPVNPQRGSLRT